MSKIYNQRIFTPVKKFAFIFALFMLFKPVIPVLEYVVFYDYIKNELCENKEIAEMECNGKCHLVKELAKASDAPENGKEKRTFPVELNLVFFKETQQTYINFVPVMKDVHEVNSVYNNLYSYSETTSVFHPPVFI
ncbi:MAG TPA: hypothetical protein VKY82_02415 [Flavobacterium sp.]|nr:hypothetical protein [Flavobacterium sp.]